MKFEIRNPNFYSVILRWNEKCDVRTCQLEILKQLRALKKLIDEEFDADPNFSEVAWVNERIAALQRLSDVDIESQDAQPLIEEIYNVCSIQEELDRVADPESAPLIGHLAWLAGSCIVREV